MKKYRLPKLEKLSTQLRRVKKDNDYERQWLEQAEASYKSIHV